MRVFDFIAVKLTLCLLTGILIGWYLKASLVWVAAFLITVLILLAIAKKFQKRNTIPFFGYLAFLSTMLLGVLCASIHLPKNQPQHYLNLPQQENELSLKITQVLKPNSYSYRYFADVVQVDEQRATGSILVYLTKEKNTKTLSVDDEFLTYASIEEIAPPLNPFQFNYKRYLAQNAVYGQIQITEKQFLPLDSSTKTLAGMASNYRAELIEKLGKLGFGEDELGVIQAILLGERLGISEEVYSHYKNAGAVHILAVSGLHVGILLFLLQLAFRPFNSVPHGKTIKLILIVFLLWVYAYIAGLSPSIVRAVTMFSFIAYALQLNRPTNTFNILALSMFFILLVKPLFLFEAGFQMSYAAVFSIIWIYPKLQRFWYPENWFLRKGWQLLSVSIAAQLGVLPITLFYFHQFPSLFFVSNLIVVPFLGIIFGLGLLVLVLTQLNSAPKIFIQFYNAVIETMNSCIRWVALQEEFLLTNIPFDKFQLVLGYAIIIGIVITLSRFRFKNLAITLLFSILYMGYLVVHKWQDLSKESVMLFHQNRNTILVHLNGRELQVLTNNFKQAEKLANSYTLAKRATTTVFDSLQNHYTIGDKKLLILNTTNTYGSLEHPDYVLLSQSPKIHLERFLDSIQPKMIVADGSNYKSYVRHWKNTCLKRKLPFHYTGEKGAYMFK